MGAGFANVCPRSSAATEHTNVRIFAFIMGSCQCHGELPLDLRSSTIQISDGGKGRQKGRVGHASARRTQDARPKTNRQSIQSTLDARAPRARGPVCATNSRHSRHATRQTRHRHAARVPYGCHTSRACQPPSLPAEARDAFALVNPDEPVAAGARPTRLHTRRDLSTRDASHPHGHPSLRLLSALSE